MGTQEVMKILKEVLYPEMFKHILKKLEEGEKYRQMWKELHDIASEFNFFPLMDKLEEKYFSKEVADDMQTNRT